MNVNKYTTEIENKWIELTEQLRESRREDEFNEIDLNQFKIKLEELAKELDQPSNISIQQDSTAFINKISVIVSSGKCVHYISIDRRASEGEKMKFFLKWI